MRSMKNNMFDLFKLAKTYFSGFMLVGDRNHVVLGKIVDQAYCEGYLECMRDMEARLPPRYTKEQLAGKIDNFWTAGSKFV